MSKTDPWYTDLDQYDSSAEVMEHVDETVDDGMTWADLLALIDLTGSPHGSAYPAAKHEPRRFPDD